MAGVAVAQVYARAGDINAQVGDERVQQQPGHAHGPGSDHDHAGRQADAESATWLRAGEAGRASAFARSHRFGFAGDAGNNAHAADSHHPSTPVQRPSAPHQHATGSGHRHASDQPGVVYVDAGADPQPPTAIVGGFEVYWSIVPAGLHIVLHRLRAAPPALKLLAQASRSDGPHERPPRG